MTITNRVSVFFQITLALILIGFSLLLYFLKQNHEFSHASERLSAAINTLAAAVEDEPEGLEWDRAALDLHFFADGEQIHWAIWDENDALVDSSDLPSARANAKRSKSADLERAGFDRVGTSGSNFDRSSPAIEKYLGHYAHRRCAGITIR